MNNLPYKIGYQKSDKYPTGLDFNEWKYVFKFDEDENGQKDSIGVNNYTKFLEEVYSKNPKNFYQVVREDKPVREYYDIDMDGKFDPEDWETENIKVVKDFLHNRNNVDRENNPSSYSSLNKDDFIILTSHKPEKLSFHLYSKQTAFKSLEQNKLFAEKLKEFVPAIDLSVYSKNRAMRLVGNSKMKEPDRPLKPIFGGNIGIMDTWIELPNKHNFKIIKIRAPPVFKHKPSEDLGDLEDQEWFQDFLEENPEYTFHLNEKKLRRNSSCYRTPCLVDPTKTHGTDSYFVCRYKGIYQIRCPQHKGKYEIPNQRVKEPKPVKEPVSVKEPEPVKEPVPTPEIPENYKYKNVKTKFERNKFKCISENNIIIVENDGSLSRRKKNDITFSYENLYYKYIHTKDDKPELKKAKFLKKWFDDEKIRTYYRVGMYPDDEKCPDDVYNSWTGFEIQKHNFDKDEYSQKDHDDLEFLLNHWKLLCDNDDQVYNYLIHWIAQMFQKPEIKPNTMMIFKTIPGLGKEEGLYNILATMLGQKLCYIGENVGRDIFGDFNPQLEGKLLVVFNEIKLSTARQFEEAIKDIITRHTDTINRKGLNQYEVPSFCRTMAFTNRDFPIFVREGDRRMVPIDSCQPRPDKDYCGRLVMLKYNLKVLRLLYNYLMSIDLGNFNFVDDRPVTQFSKDLEELSRPIELEFIINFVQNLETELTSYTPQELFDSFKEFLQTNSTGGNKNYQISLVGFTKKINKMGIQGIEKHHTGSRRQYNIRKTECIEWLVKKNYLSFE